MADRGLRSWLAPKQAIGSGVSPNVITKKADAKLNYVVTLYRHALGVHFGGSGSRFLEKRIYLKGMRFLDEIELLYKVENRFFAVSYDLVYRASVPCREAPAYDGGLRFSAVPEGKLAITGAHFVSDAEDGDAFAERRVRDLNHSLIIDRIVSMDLTDISVSHDAEGGAWAICCRSIIGSTTWNLIPPITQLIKPREEECLRLIEFFELVAAAVL
jgi:hypothetical protein